MFDLLGNTIDEKGDFKSDIRLPIHRSAPKFDELTTSSEILVTGIKVIDLLNFFGVRFLMTSFRLKNMTTDNVYDVSKNSTGPCP